MALYQNNLINKKQKYFQKQSCLLQYSSENIVHV